MTSAYFEIPLYIILKETTENTEVRDSIRLGLEIGSLCMNESVGPALNRKSVNIYKMNILAAPQVFDCTSVLSTIIIYTRNIATEVLLVCSELYIVLLVGCGASPLALSRYALHIRPTPSAFRGACSSTGKVKLSP